MDKINQIILIGKLQKELIQINEFILNLRKKVPSEVFSIILKEYSECPLGLQNLIEELLVSPSSEIDPQLEPEVFAFE